MSDDNSRKVRVTASGSGDDATFFVFGLPERVSALGPAARAVVDRAFEQARNEGSAEIDLDELRSARDGTGQQ